VLRVMRLMVDGLKEHAVVTKKNSIDSDIIMGNVRNVADAVR